MFETTELLLKQISLGEDSSLELKNLSFKEDKIITPHKEVWLMKWQLLPTLLAVL